MACASALAGSTCSAACRCPRASSGLPVSINMIAKAVCAEVDCGYRRTASAYRRMLSSMWPCARKVLAELMSASR